MQEDGGLQLHFVAGVRLKRRHIGLDQLEEYCGGFMGDMARKGQVLMTAEARLATQRLTISSRLLELFPGHIDVRCSMQKSQAAHQAGAISVSVA